VFHIDRWWNPAVENQATDRAYRIGQQKRVMVHKFITSGSVEERIDRMIQEKSKLAADIVGSGEDWLGGLDIGQLRDLVALEES
jgi:SNF2 family DNA or RNA helicase